MGKLPRTNTIIFFCILPLFQVPQDTDKAGIIPHAPDTKKNNDLRTKFAPYVNLKYVPPTKISRLFWELAKIGRTGKMFPDLYN